jgi:hypothetical protein
MYTKRTQKKNKQTNKKIKKIKQQQKSKEKMPSARGTALRQHATTVS